MREDFIGSEALPNSFEITAQHLVSPDAGTAPNPVVLSLILFANSPTPGGPARGPFLVFGPHDLTFDYLRVSYVPIAPGQSQLVIEASHGSPPATIPEPSAMLLFGSAVLGLAAEIKRRRQSAKDPNSISNISTLGSVRNLYWQ